MPTIKNIRWATAEGRPMVVYELDGRERFSPNLHTEILRAGYVLAIPADNNIDDGEQFKQTVTIENLAGEQIDVPLEPAIESNVLALELLEMRDFARDDRGLDHPTSPCRTPDFGTTWLSSDHAVSKSGHFTCYWMRTYHLLLTTPSSCVIQLSCSGDMGTRYATRLPGREALPSPRGRCAPPCVVPRSGPAARSRRRRRVAPQEHSLAWLAARTNRPSLMPQLHQPAVFTTAADHTLTRARSGPVAQLDRATDS